MTVIPLPSVSQVGAGSDGRRTDWTEPRHFARDASGLVHDATGPLLGALIDAIAAAALESAITTAGRTLADREVRISPGR
jgi:hypothetical protein